MHPAYSVIFFTTASGAGYGLLVWLGVFALTGVLPAERWLGVTGFGLAFALITFGLLSSTFHLGRPERAWRAFSQWRSSWLSREGVLAAFSYAPAALFALGWIFLGRIDGLWAIAGWISILTALATVACTAMIYASLKTIRQWNMPMVVIAVYLALALATGGILLVLLAACFGYASNALAWTALCATALAGIVKLIYWRAIDADQGRHTAGEATGLGSLGAVRPLDPPHSTPNFVQREMGYHVARKHARRLRVLALLLLCVAPIALLALSLSFAGPAALLFSVCATALAAIGVVMERWLFFAEAQHVVTLYYGAERA